MNDTDLYSEILYDTYLRLKSPFCWHNGIFYGPWLTMSSDMSCASSINIMSVRIRRLETLSVDGQLSCLLIYV